MTDTAVAIEIDGKDGEDVVDVEKRGRRLCSQRLGVSSYHLTSTVHNSPVPT